MSDSSLLIVRLNRVDLVTLSSVVTTSLAAGVALAGHLHLAVALLFLAMLADALDGILARQYGLTRDFGRYLDGFMDVLIYLVTPSLIMYLSGFCGWLFSPLLMLFIACGCIRLSVFNEIGNIQESDGLSYLGMPVFWSVFMLAIYQLLMLIWIPLAQVLLAIALLLFAFCMLWRRPFFKFKSRLQIFSITLGGFALFLLLHWIG
jgi:CDP-diacylglycerol--serine O-phosphatidyltransferase